MLRGELWWRVPGIRNERILYVYLVSFRAVSIKERDRERAAGLHVLARAAETGSNIIIINIASHWDIHLVLYSVKNENENAE